MTAPADIPALIAEGRRLIAAATPGPLEANSYGHIWASDRKLAEVSGVVQAACYPRRTAKQERADLLRFVFAVNNLAALLDVAEAAARNSWAREEYGLASGASHAERGSICETCERTRDAAQAVLDSEVALDSALSRLRGVWP